MRPFADPLLAELELLYTERFREFVRVAQAILGDRERALEAVQDAFAGAIRGRGAFRGEAPLDAWVWRAVVNAARKAARRPLVEVRPARPEPLELPPALAVAVVAAPTFALSPGVRGFFGLGRPPFLLRAVPVLSTPAGHGLVVRLWASPVPVARCRFVAVSRVGARRAGGGMCKRGTGG